MLAVVVAGSCDGMEMPTSPSFDGPAFIQITGDAHWTDWSEYETGVQPVGFTQMWDPTAFFSVADDTVAGGKVLEWSAAGQSRNRWGLAYDGLGDVADQQVYTEFRVRSLGAGTSIWYMGSAAVRMTGTASDEGGYAVWFVANGAQRSIALATWTNGGYAQLGHIPLAWTNDIWYSVRLEAFGSTIRTRIWERGTPEPAFWQVSVTDTRWPSGRPGVSNHDNGHVQWDFWEATTSASPPPPPPPPAFTFYTAFGDSAPGTAPAGWTETSQPANSDWTLASDLSSLDGQVLRNTTTATGRHILRLDAVPDTTGTQEVVVRMRLSDSDGRGPGVALRHTMNGSSESAYVAYLRPSTNQVEINRFLSGGWMFVGAGPFVNTPGEWYWLRFRAEGNSLRVKVWNDGATEPAAWTLELNEGALAAGSVGLYVYEANVVDYDLFGFAAGGGTAPGAVVPPPPTLTALVVKPDSASLAIGATLQFQAYGLWSDGDSTAIPVSYSASGGSVDATGLYTAGSTAGTFQLVASHTGSPALADTANVTITTAPPPPPPVFTFSTDFGTDPLNLPPPGWTETSQPNNSTWTVIADGSVPSGQVLRNVTTSTGRHILRFDGSADTTAAQEVVVRMRMADGDTRGPGIALRHTMNGSLESAYVAYLRPNSNQVEINRFLNGGWLTLGAAAFVSDPGQWYWIRFRAEGAALRVKVWPDGTPEPASWTREVNDSGLAAGAVGLYVYENNTVDYGAFGYAAGGATAPGAVVTPPPPPPTLTALVVKPDSATLAIGAALQFQAYGLWSDGDSTAIPVSFSASGGSVDASGLYSAGPTIGTFQLVASHTGSPALADTATISITAAPPPPPPAFTFSTDFGTDSLNVQPLGWTETSQPNNSAWTVVADGSVASGRVLRNVTTGTARHILRLDGSPDTTATQEVLVRMRLADGDNRGPGIALRHTMNGNLESAYVAYLRPNTNQVEINRFLNGGWLFVGDGAFVNDPGEWYWIRFRAESTTLRVKVWTDGTPEPAAWTRELNDSGLAAGAAGLYTYENNTVDYSLFGYAAGGATAPGAN